MPIDEERYRSLAASFPTGVAIVTARDVDGRPKGLTTQSFVGLSIVPPLMLVTIARTSRTLSALLAARAFVINFVKAGAEDVAVRFATKDEDKFAGIAWEPSASAAGAAILRDAAHAYAECVLKDAIEAGDHWILVGQVEGGEVLSGDPLLYYRRRYAGWPPVP